MARTPDSENISIANALSRLWGSALAEEVLLENELVFEKNRLQGDVLHIRFRQGNRVFSIRFPRGRLLRGMFLPAYVRAMSLCACTLWPQSFIFGVRTNPA